MRLAPVEIAEWPKLAWVARHREDEDVVTVYHGPMVEVRADWLAEAVWAGDFAAGDFDRTDLIFGTGIRCRDDRVVFVPSGTTTDRMWHCRRNGTLFVSNSLPALLAASGGRLALEHHYFRDIRTVCEGLAAYQRSIPLADGDVRVRYFHNLVLDETGLHEQGKPDPCPELSTYEQYRQYLSDTAGQLQRNMADAGRSYRITPLTTVSSGYDSCASAVVAIEAGCTRAVTIRQSNSFWRGEDSGEDVSRALGLEVTCYDRRTRNYPDEHAIWAVSGRAGIVNWTQFDYPEPLCAFFTGCRGDMSWDRSDADVDRPFRVPSVSDMGITEWRLLKGVFHVVVPFWGLRHANEIRAISRSADLDPWSVGGRYDRPIARRIVEEAGVHRDAFGRIKRNSSAEEYVTWPHSAEGRRSVRAYLRRQGIAVPPEPVVWICRRIAACERLFYLNVVRPLHLPDLSLRTKVRFRASRLLFHWGNDVLKEEYASGLGRAGEGDR